MPHDTDSTNVNIFQQWAILIVVLATLGGVICYFQYQEYQRIDAQEREKLATQAEIIEKNLTPQLLLANRVIESIIKDLPSWQSAHDARTPVRLLKWTVWLNSSAAVCISWQDVQNALLSIRADVPA